MNKVVISFIALVIVFFILRESELYTNLVLDTNGRKHVTDHSLHPIHLISAPLNLLVIVKKLKCHT